MLVEHVLLVLSLTAAVCLGNELKDYCSMHKFDNLPGGLRFTKEVVTTEYANVGAFKALHCCLRGYRSIEWTFGRSLGNRKPPNKGISPRSFSRALDLPVGSFPRLEHGGTLLSAGQNGTLRAPLSVRAVLQVSNG
ncbi:hypothetical protein KM043_009354 [Ampulex compressa]|nr:hypothetical protein KM043_009354 [Ampulex compressa]